MNLLDLAVVALLASAVLGGWKLGLLTGGTSWVFLLQGLAVATLAMPVVSETFANVPAVRLFAAATVFVGAGFAAQWAGRLVGREFRRALPDGPAGDYDRLAGAVVGPLAVLVGAWLLVLAPMAAVAGWPSDLVRGSALARGLDAVLPGAPDASDALGKLAGPARMPEVSIALGPAGDSSPPPERPDLAAAVLERVKASTVKVEGLACGVAREGSGFTVDDDVVVTNAHVVAGQRRTTVLRPDGTRLPAAVTVFDPDRDLALLRVVGLGQAPLPLARTAEAGSVGAVLGHPDGQDELAVSPARVRWETAAAGTDLYGLQEVTRQVYVLSARLRPGDSGGALVDRDGAVTGVAFAVAPWSTTVAYALSVDELRPLLDRDRTAGPVATGPCV
jgi:S1-C subfamily serine protease